MFKQEIDTLNQFAEFTKYEIRCQYDVVNREFKIDANIAGTATDTYITSSGLKIKSIDANIQFSAKNAFNFYFAHVAGAAIKGPSGSAMENNYVMGFNLSKDGSQSLQDQQINIVVNGTITTPENETLIGTWQSQGSGDDFKGAPSFEKEEMKAYYVCYFFLMSITQPALFPSAETEAYWNRFYFASNYYMNANIQ